tara:strand:+ start:5766 stop:5936 length:171 start_codon:yes stop_codon:yes gene_type:complete
LCFENWHVAICDFAEKVAIYLAKVMEIMKVEEVEELLARSSDTTPYKHSPLPYLPH